MNIDIETINSLVEKYCNVSGLNEVSCRMQNMGLLADVLSVNEVLKSQIALLAERPVMSVSSRERYDDCRRRIAYCINDSVRKKSSLPDPANFGSRLAESVFPYRESELEQEEAEKMEQAADHLAYGWFGRSSAISGAVDESLEDLSGYIAQIADLAETPWTKRQYELLMGELEREYADAPSTNGESARDFYGRWKRTVYDEQDEFPDLISILVKDLLNSAFIIVDDSHSGFSYKKTNKELAFYVGGEETTVEWQKKFATLCKIAGYQDRRFLFRESTLGRYIYQHRSSLSEDAIKSFFFFMQVCQFAYADMDNASATDAAEHCMNKEEGSEPPATVDIMSELQAIFRNNREEAAAFIRRIDGAKSTFITEEVNRLLREEKITKAGCKRDLWRILHENGYYKPSESNWNSQVNN